MAEAAVEVEADGNKGTDPAILDAVLISRGPVVARGSGTRGRICFLGWGSRSHPLEIAKSYITKSPTDRNQTFLLYLLLERRFCLNFDM